MHHHKMMELGVLSVLMLLEFTEHTKLLQGGIEIRPIYTCWVIPDVFEPSRFHPHLVDLLEENMKELGDKAPTLRLNGRRLRGGPAFSQDVTVETISLCDENSTKVHNELPVELR
jgi:hypothetical protein